jgi:hypothetical protein
VVSVQREAALAAVRPLDTLKPVGWHPEAILLDFGRVANVVDIAEVDREVGLGCDHELRDGLGLLRSGAPVTGNSYPDGVRARGRR